MVVDLIFQNKYGNHVENLETFDIFIESATSGSWSHKGESEHGPFHFNDKMDLKVFKDTS